jgi:hypothetical protein
MCGIIASKSLEEFKELVIANQSRGSFSHSLTVFEFDDNYDELLYKVMCYKNFGPFDFNNIVFRNLDQIHNPYFIGHVQAPTGGLIEDYNRIHPSVVQNCQYLYHNGILKHEYIVRHSNKEVNVWDTSLLNQLIYSHGFTCLDSVKGSFACILIQDDVLYNDNPLLIYCFRNNNSPLYYSDNLSFSSMKIDGFHELVSGEVFLIDLKTNQLVPHQAFKLLDNYYIEI